MNNLSFVDIFAGASGLAEGFISAGYLPVAHVEVDKYACLTIKTRSAYHYCKRKNLLDHYYEYYTDKISRDEFYKKIPFNELESIIQKEINEKNFDSIIKIIENSQERLGEKSVDVLLGGPPCQAYSLIGRKVNESKKKSDERIYYYRLYIKFLKKLKPKIFVFENVPGLLSFENGFVFDDLKESLKKAGYSFDYRILNAADFGVLQNRRRIIIIGWEKELNLGYPVFEKAVNKYKVNDLFKDLPFLESGNNLGLFSYNKKASKYVFQSGIRNGFGEVNQNITRPINHTDRQIYKTAIKLWNKNKQRLKYTDLPEKLRTHNNHTSFLDRFKVVAGEESAAHTLIAHIAKDGHYFIHPDINQCRSISVREAARIQSFPDDFYFEGPRTAIFTQIGNAVPPQMAFRLAEKIKYQLKNV